MEPASRNAWAMYISTPPAMSSMSITWYTAMAMELRISTTAIEYWVTLAGLHTETKFEICNINGFKFIMNTNYLPLFKRVFALRRKEITERSNLVCFVRFVIVWCEYEHHIRNVLITTPKMLIIESKTLTEFHIQSVCSSVRSAGALFIRINL